MQATLTFLGTGTSMGVPTLGCDCAVCVSAVSPGGGGPAPSPRNRRTRPSVLISWEGHNVVIDTGPDFHAQAIAAGIHRLDAVLYTHGHADHVLGMDDLRPLSFHSPGSLPLYADEQTALTIERIFNYTFSSDRQYPTRARVALHRIPTTPGAEVELFGVKFLRVPVTHGRQTITGFRFGSAAYLTDLSDLHPESLPLLSGLDLLILDALRREPHPTHSHLDKSIALVGQLSPCRAFFTHISHGLDHDATNATLPSHIRLAHDGLQLQFEIAPAPTGSPQSP
jgi:phosphoribosyl 1,2-cyclic phosphate phosphodiesterase